MAVTAVVGLQWGDEGKGKIVDLLAREARWIVRFHGGANAGHTVQVGGETFILHLIPAGILQPHTRCVIGSGVVVDPEVLLAEMEALTARGIRLAGRLFVSPRAHLVLPYHHALDRALEEEGGRRLGTTGRGIGPAYADKAARRGVRAEALREPLRLEREVRAGLEFANRVLVRVLGREPLAAEAVLATTSQWAAALGDLVVPVEEELRAAWRSGEAILLEGAQGLQLDLDYGTYPYVTSSSVLSFTAGAGLPPQAVERVLGVTKAYTTRVGEGPFPTEVGGELGERLRQVGGEFGATTGRPRRCGWLDLVALRHGIALTGAEALAVTKLDTLRGVDPLRVCVAYRLRGETLTAPPPAAATLTAVEPQYVELPGFREPVEEVRRYEELPAAARRYLQFLEEQLEVPVTLVSVGREREQVIRR